MADSAFRRDGVHMLKLQTAHRTAGCLLLPSPYGIDEDKRSACSDFRESVRVCLQARVESLRGGVFR